MKSTLLVTSLFTSLAVSCGTTEKESQVRKRPNILIAISDDQSFIHTGMAVCIDIPDLHPLKPSVRFRRASQPAISSRQISQRLRQRSLSHHNLQPSNISLLTGSANLDSPKENGM